MQTRLTEQVKQTSDGAAAAVILRKCVHCGFCLATCPTYQLLGDELDSPRGRIYLIKQMLEGERASEKTQLHLDRCLTCRACETTCPSGVEYGHLLQIGREHVEKNVPRRPVPAVVRYVLEKVLAHRARFEWMLGAARALRPVLPATLRRRVPSRRTALPWPAPRHARRMIVLEGCVQPALDPRINSSAARLLDRIGISLVCANGAGCCGAISHHFAARERALDHARRNIDAWWPLIDGGAEAIVVTASGCCPTVLEYAHLLHDDPHYAQKAARISALVRDISQVIAEHAEDLLKEVQTPPETRSGPKRVAFHSPCSLQHGLKIRGVVERLLTSAGFDLVPVADSHLCCGSAGTYSITQPELSRRLLERKIEALERGAPDVIATANIGCLMHIGSASRAPVVHWVQLLAESLP